MGLDAAWAAVLGATVGGSFGVLGQIITARIQSQREDRESKRSYARALKDKEFDRIHASLVALTKEVHKINNQASAILIAEENENNRVPGFSVDDAITAFLNEVDGYYQALDEMLAILSIEPRGFAYNMEIHTLRTNLQYLEGWANSHKSSEGRMNNIRLWANKIRDSKDDLAKGMRHYMERLVEID